MGDLKNNKGMVFIVAISLMVIFMSFALTLTSIAKRDIQAANNSFKMLKDFYSAESGIEHAIADIKDAGTGFVWADDLYTDNAGQDYNTNYDTVNSTILSSSNYLEESYRQIKVVILDKPFYAAYQVGNTVTVTWPPASGTITGDVEAGGTVDLGSMTVTGSTNAEDSDVFIPVPDMTLTGYLGAATYTYPGPTTSWNAGNPPQGDAPTYYPGIHYINGSLTITAPSAFRLDGTIVATGDVLFNVLATSVTLNPSGTNPAVVSSGGNVRFVSCGNLTINGAIYAGGDVRFETVSGTNTVNGVVVAGQDIEMASVSIDIHDPGDVSPPYFSSPPLSLRKWIGHQDVP